MKDCWYNAKGKGKGAQQKGGVHAVSDDTSSQLSAGPSASVAGSTATTAVTTKPGVRHISDQKMRILAVSGERQGYLLVDTGATVSVCRPETFLDPVNTAARQTLYSVAWTTHPWTPKARWSQRSSWAGDAAKRQRRRSRW